MLALLAFAILNIAPPAGGSPYRAPQLAASSKLVVLAYGSGHEIFVAASKDQGKTFAPPVKVAEGGGLPLGRPRGPRGALKIGRGSGKGRVEAWGRGRGR